MIKLNIEKVLSVDYHTITYQQFITEKTTIDSRKINTKNSFIKDENRKSQRKFQEHHKYRGN